MKTIFPEIIYGNRKFKAISGIRKCDKCDKYGHIEVLNYLDQPENGSYYPYCNCDFGKYLKSIPDEPQMFEQRRR
jgi:hypothetical protein